MLRRSGSRCCLSSGRISARSSSARRRPTSAWVCTFAGRAKTRQRTEVSREADLIQDSAERRQGHGRGKRSRGWKVVEGMLPTEETAEEADIEASANSACASAAAIGSKVGVGDRPSDGDGGY